MSLRTVQMLGRAYSPDGTDLTLSVIVNGQETHGTTVPTEVGPTPDVGTVTSTNVLMTFDVDHTEFVAGNLPVSITPTGGDVIFDSFFMNHQQLDFTNNNSIITVNTKPQDYYIDINTNTVNTDGKINVKIDGVDPDNKRPTTVTEDLVGEWYYSIPDGSTMTFEYVVEDVPYVQLQEFTGNGTQSTYTLTTVESIVGITIDNNFVVSTEYTYDNTAKTVTFNAAPANGAAIAILTQASSTTP